MILPSVAPPADVDHFPEDIHRTQAIQPMRVLRCYSTSRGGMREKPEQRGTGVGTRPAVEPLRPLSHQHSSEALSGDLRPWPAAADAEHAEAATITPRARSAPAERHRLHYVSTEIAAAEHDLSPVLDAGVAQWQSKSLPSSRRGFDSLRPLLLLLYSSFFFSSSPARSAALMPASLPPTVALDDREVGAITRVVIREAAAGRGVGSPRTPPARRRARPVRTEL